MTAVASPKSFSVRSKLLASTALIGAAAAAAGLGTFGSFISTTSASEQVTSGTVQVQLGAAGTANRLSVAATGVIPGDTIARAVTISNTGSENFAALTLTTAATTSSVLDTDATNGLQLQIQKCSAEWTEAGAAPAYTYTCSGTTSTVLASRAVVGANLPLAGLSSLAAGGSDSLLVTLSLPTAADNSFQGKTSTIGLAFTATQRNGSSH